MNSVVPIATLIFGFVAVISAFQPYDNVLPDFEHQDASGTSDGPPKPAFSGGEQTGSGAQSNPNKPFPPAQTEQSTLRPPAPGANQPAPGPQSSLNKPANNSPSGPGQQSIVNKPGNNSPTGSGPRPSTGRPIKTTTIKMKKCARGIKWPLKPRPPPKEADSTNGFGCSVYPDIFSGVKETCKKLTPADKKTGSYFWYCCYNKWNKPECI